jgi:tetratricopeptide (TPR) repeat protein
MCVLRATYRASRIVGLKAEPAAAPLYVARGVLYVQLAKYEEAEDDFEKAEQLEPSRQIASVNVAQRIHAPLYRDAMNVVKSCCLH